MHFVHGNAGFFNLVPGMESHVEDVAGNQIAQAKLIDGAAFSRFDKFYGLNGERYVVNQKLGIFGYFFDIHD
jgi:hypothetical protein